MSETTVPVTEDETTREDPRKVADRRLRITVGVLAVLGIGIAGYLTYVHYQGGQVLCLASGGCETVQSSIYAKLAGVPVALLGLIGYVLILASVFVPKDAGRLMGATLSLIGLGFSGYLTYRELFSIHAICQWCVASAILMVLLSVVTVIRLLRAPVD
jgi:uncharacterized membrane protein